MAVFQATAVCAWVKNRLCEPALNISASVSFFADVNQLSLLESLILDNNMDLHLLPATLLKMENLKIIGLSWYVITMHFLVKSLSVLVSMLLIKRPRK